jgi:hypothetical protein
MSTPSADQVQQLRRTYDQAGQGHVFTFWDKLSSQEQSNLFHQLSSIDPNRVNSIHKSSLQAERDAAKSTHDDITPPPADQSGSVISNPDQAREWNQIGLAAIRDGKVAVLLMAGGQGTRPGCSAPEGRRARAPPRFVGPEGLLRHRVAVAQEPVPTPGRTDPPPRDRRGSAETSPVVCHDEWADAETDRGVLCRTRLLWPRQGQRRLL